MIAGVSRFRVSRITVPAAIVLAVLAVMVIAVGISQVRAQTGVLCVDGSGQFGSDCWADGVVYTDLQVALADANDGDEIWIAEGTYLPAAVDSGNRGAVFSIANGVTLYGGFPAGGGDGSFGARNLENYVTTLSGNLGDQSTSADNSYTVVTFGNGVTASIDGVTVTGGNANGTVGAQRGGGGIHVAVGATATLINSRISGNQSGYVGGGIWNFGTVGLTNSIVSDNTSGVDGAGIYNDAGVVILSENSSIISNSASDSGGGIATFQGLVTLSSSTVTDNEAAFDGGGIYNNSGQVVLTDSSVDDNEADREGGGIFNDGGSATLSLTNSIVSNNKAPYGGGVLNLSGEISMIGSIVSDNEAGNTGGGIFNISGDVTLENSSVSSNKANVTGGGIRNGDAGDVTLINSTVSGNEASLNGGGIRNGENGDLTLINSIVSGNAVVGESIIGGGGIHSNPSGGDVTLINSTVSGNRVDAGEGGGIFEVPGNLTLVNSIVWGNYATDLAGGEPTSVSHAIIGSGCPTGATECSSDDPLFVNWIDPNQSGWEPTTDGNYRLLPGSPAIDAGDDDAYDAVEFGDEDLDGNPRFMPAPDGPIDLGAYEAQFTQQALSLTAPPAAVVGTDATVRVALTADGFDSELAEGATVILSGHNGAEGIVLDDQGAGSTTVSSDTLGVMELSASFGTLSDQATIDWQQPVISFEESSYNTTAGEAVTLTADVTVGDDPVGDGVEIRFVVEGANAGTADPATGVSTTENGQVSFTYINSTAGQDEVRAFYDADQSEGYTEGNATDTATVTINPAGPGSITLSVNPGKQTVEQVVTVTAIVRDQFGNHVADDSAVVVDIAGSNAEEPTRTDGGSGLVAYTSNGEATLEYTRFFPGIDTISASAGDEPNVATSDSANVEWILPDPTYGISVTARHFTSFQTAAMANPRGGAAGMVIYSAPGIHLSTRVVTTVVVDGNQATIYGRLNDGQFVRIDLVRGPNTARVRLADFDSGTFQLHQLQYR